MAKTKKIYICSGCNYESINWLGRCPNCQSWNSFVEETRISETAAADKGINSWLEDTAGRSEAVELNQAAGVIESRFAPLKDFTDFNRVLGGGLVKGSLTLLGGEPGIGKSTLLLQLCRSVAAARILYVCGEESPAQIKLRADRLGIKRSGIYLYPEVNFHKICQMAQKLQADLLIVDSIQTVYMPESSGNLGAVSQIKNAAAGFLRLCKSKGITGILVGHVTKEGQIAGPLVLEHMVDTVLMFEGDANHDLRMLRATKNRFGTVNELAVFQMTNTGLQEIQNPSHMLLANRPEGVSGSAVTAQLEGVRPLLLEVQALLNNANIGQAMRMTQGFDRNRLNMLLALLSKQFSLNLLNYDAFINVIGGLRIIEPACDLAVAAAILSSYYDMPLPNNSLFLGELGLTGELRSVNNIERRLNEAKGLGINQVFLPSADKSALSKSSLSTSLNLYFLDQLKQLTDICWQKTT